MAGTTKRYRDGTHRACSPEDTLARWRHLMPALGITRLANLTGLDDLSVPVYSAIRPQGRSLSTSQGKGFSDAAAAVSALMESIETWHAEHIARPRVSGSFSSLRKTVPLIDVTGLPTDGRVAKSAIVDWVQGWDLISQSPRWVPLDAVSLDCVGVVAPRYAVTSNGLASGNHLNEAMVHGLCEVIERDAEASWRVAGDERRVVLDTIDEPRCQDVIARARHAGARVVVWDLTSDVGIPVYGAVLLEDPHSPTGRSLGIHFGFGCHLEPRIAVARALTEAVQTRLTYIAGSRDDFFPADYQRGMDPELLADAWQRITEADSEPVDFADAPQLATRTFEGDLQVVVSALADVGAEQIVAVDLTRQEFGVPVVKMLVPGRATQLEHMA